jgi:hypothetical protein
MARTTVSVRIDVAKVIVAITALIIAVANIVTTL